MIKKVFSEPEIEVINFDEDVIATSGGENTPENVYEIPTDIMNVDLNIFS